MQCALSVSACMYTLHVCVDECVRMCGWLLVGCGCGCGCGWLVDCGCGCECVVGCLVVGVGVYIFGSLMISHNLWCQTKIHIIFLHYLLVLYSFSQCYIWYEICRAAADTCPSAVKLHHSLWLHTTLAIPIWDIMAHVTTIRKLCHQHWLSSLLLAHLLYSDSNSDSKMIKINHKTRTQYCQQADQPGSDYRMTLKDSMPGILAAVRATKMHLYMQMSNSDIFLWHIVAEGVICRTHIDILYLYYTKHFMIP